MAFFGFKVLIPSIIIGVGYIASAVFLAIALKQLPLGTAYLSLLKWLMYKVCWICSDSVLNTNATRQEI